MKKLLLLITLFISVANTQAQIVNIPDANFKNALLNYIFVIDINGDGEIQVVEANAFTEVMDVSSQNISDLTGIEAFTNMTELYCSDNLLTSLDVSNLTNLTGIFCGQNQLTTINISGDTNLTELSCSHNQLANLDISGATNLEFLNCANNLFTTLDLSDSINLTSLYCTHNQLTTLNLSGDINLRSLYCYYNQLATLDLSENINLRNLICYNNSFTSLDLSANPIMLFDCQTRSTLQNPNATSNLIYLNLKNGLNDLADIIGEDYLINHNPNLQFVCVDDINSNFTAVLQAEVDPLPVTFTTYCSFSPAQSNIISGNLKVDIDNNGCDVNDIPIGNRLITADNGTASFATFTQDNGDYLLYTNEGNFTTTASVNLPSYFSTNSQSNTFTGFDNTFTADFCIVPNQTVNDVNISIIPINTARPGFDASYQIVYKNMGTTQLSGTVTIDFDDTKLDFLNASETVNSQTSTSLSFDYANLNPFETRIINLVFNVHTPTATQPVNNGDILTFTATINPVTGDYTPDDNMFTLDQTVVNSYDPNDITCLEGDEILEADTDNYLHYVIRFQNTGTASAINIVVANELDAKLDWSTLQLESASHSNRVAIKNANEVEFIFEDINLADSTSDEPNSHGFVAYKIKPKASIALGDVISNIANIFFDYNAAIVTNTATTTVVNALSVNNNALLDFTVYPVPTTNILNINAVSEVAKIEIYNKLGQLVLQEIAKDKIAIANLAQGFYFVKVTDVNGDFGVRKIVKE